MLEVTRDQSGSFGYHNVSSSANNRPESIELNDGKKSQVEKISLVFKDFIDNVKNWVSNKTDSLKDKITHITKFDANKIRVIKTISIVFLGVLTFGLFPLVLFFKSNSKRDWKTFPNIFGNNKNFSYKKPKLKPKKISPKKASIDPQVKESCKQEMRQAMKVLDTSLVDGIKTLLEQGELEQAVETLNRFSNRVMDVYEAYVEVLADEGVPLIPSNIGVIKSSGFTHKEIVKLKEPCTWYCDKVAELHKELRKIKLKKKELHVVSDYLAAKKYNQNGKSISSASGLNPAGYNTQINNPTSTTEEQNYKKLLGKYPQLVDTIEKLSKEFCEELSKDTKNLETIKAFDRRVTFARLLSQREKEVLKQQISEFDFQTTSNMLTADVRGRLLEELRHRFSWRDFEPGYVGNPLTLLNIIRGKHDDQVRDAHFRTKLFFIYGSKNIINEIASSEKLSRQINEKLNERNKGWQLDEKLIGVMRKKSKTDPVYKLGVYARENNLGNGTRRGATHEEMLQYGKDDPNLTFAEAERIASDEGATPDELIKRFRIKLYEAEEMAFFGTTSSLDEAERERKFSYFLTGGKRSEQVDASYHETSLEHYKRTNQIHWKPGKHFYKLYGKDVCKSPYLDAVEKLGLPQYSGISGSSDQTFSMAGIVGVQSKDELLDLRLLYIPWMGAHEDHTADEILVALKSFGLPYTPAADYYNHIYPPLQEKLTLEVQKAQRKRGYELPDYYLSEDHLNQKTDESQHKRVQGLLESNNLYLHGTRTYRKNYSLNDLFADNKWKSYTDFLTDKRIDEVNKKRQRKRNWNVEQSSDKVRYDLDFQEGTYKPHADKEPSIYKGTHKQCLTLVPPKGKVIPYVPFDYPHLNRVGILFDGNECQFKKEKFVFQYDANTDIESKWKTTYSQEDISDPNFDEKVKADAEEAIEFNRKWAHQIGFEQLVENNIENQDTFIPYNEVNASIHNKGMVGIFTFSRGLPKYTDRKVAYNDQKEKYLWAPLHHESAAEHQEDADYDCYMILMGIGKRIATREKFGVDLPLYQINEIEDLGLTLISRKDQISLLKAVIENENGIQDGIIRVIKHQSDINADDEDIRVKLIEKLKHYLSVV